MASGVTETIIGGSARCGYTDNVLGIGSRASGEVKARKSNDCSSGSRCESAFSKAANVTAPNGPLLKFGGSIKACFNRTVSANLVPRVLTTRCNHTSKDGGYGRVVSQPAGKVSVAEKNFCSANTTADLPKDEIDHSPTQNCCGVGSSKPVPVRRSIEEDDCSGKECCISKASVNSSASTCQGDAETDYFETFNAVPAGAITASQAGIDNLDMEKGLLPSEHIVLSVQGMTCTGCERKLHKSLKSLSAVSNIKTSIILSQAEFDLCGSVPGGSIISFIEKRTGFTCTKVVQKAIRLDMTLDGGVRDLAENEDRPFGVTDLIILNKTMIRVIYDPDTIGARDLLSNSFFQGAKLSPVAPDPIISTGRAHAHSVLLMTLLSTLLTIPVLILSWAPLPDHEVYMEPFR
jgi:copper chaperone CopZ